jgi:hypothetical protein
VPQVTHPDAFRRMYELKQRLDDQPANSSAHVMLDEQASGTPSASIASRVENGAFDDFTSCYV